MRAKKLIAVTALTALPLIAAAGGQGAEKVWVCHFPGHEAPESWNAGGTVYDGDYVLTTQPAEGEEPTQRQVDWCADKGGNGIIHISERAATHGHGAQ